MSNTNPNLGKYQVLEEIGRGGMGAVYKGYDLYLDRTVAIKLLAPHLAWEKGFLDRFLREARAAAKLQHPHIIPIYDVGQDGTNYYFVMAYLPGASLKQLVEQKGRFAPAEVIPILRQLADALDYAHSKGLVHRDVKPANVMFDEHDQVMLTDFGIVKAAEESRLTATGASIGTPQYMSPEQIQGGEVDAYADEYSFGIIAYEMLTGRVPFDSTTITAILLKHVTEPPPSIVACCPDLPPAVEGVINRVLAKTPAQRYSSCSEFVNALDQALTTRTAPQPQQPWALPAEQTPTILAGQTAQPTWPPPARPSLPSTPAARFTPPPAAPLSSARASQPLPTALTAPPPTARKATNALPLILGGVGILGVALIALVALAAIAFLRVGRPTSTPPAGQNPSGVQPATASPLLAFTLSPTHTSQAPTNTLKPTNTSLPPTDTPRPTNTPTNTPRPPTPRPPTPTQPPQPPPTTPAPAPKCVTQCDTCEKCDRNGCTTSDCRCRTVCP